MGIEVYGTVARKFFRFAKTVIIVQGNKLRKILSYKTKLAVLWGFWVNFFLLSAEKFARVVKTATYKALKHVEEKHCLKLCTMLQNSSVFQPKKQRIGEKIFFGIVTTAIRASRAKFRWKKIFEKLYFPLQFWSLSNLVVNSKQFGQMCQNSILRAQRKKFGGRVFRKKCFL